MAGGIRWHNVVAWTLVAMATSSGTGCNMLSVPYFLFCMDDPKQQAEIQKIASPNKKEERKVVVLTYHRLDLRPEFVNSDRELCRLSAFFKLYLFYESVCLRSCRLMCFGSL